MEDIFGKVTVKRKYPFNTQVCPGCGEVYPVRTIRQHVTIWAKREAWDYMLLKSRHIPHFNFYAKHTTDARTPNLTKRVWIS